MNYWYEEAEKAISPADAPPPGLSTASKNRRLAYMRRLEKEGEYFSEDNMRSRAPLLWHEYIGQHEGEPVQSHEGEQLHDTLLRAHDELRIRSQLEEQLMEQECQVSEEEEEEEEGEDREELTMPGGRVNAAAAVPEGKQDTASICSSGATAVATTAVVSDQQQPGYREERRAELLDEMQRRFLDGVDTEHVNYAEIDANAQLDEDWAAEQTQDAEDAYFDAD